MKSHSPCRLHVVSLQVPYPPDYGGVIDIYYKLKALKESGVTTWLHTYQYGRGTAPQLEEVADRVSYYPRQCSWTRQLSSLPYIVASRQSSQLLADLLDDDAPILFEGLHCCAFLNDKRLAGRTKWVRTHNVEHDYYRGLAQKASGWRKAYYLLEASKLRQYEQNLRHANAILAITESDRNYFASRYPSVPALLLPAFHAHESVKPATATGDYILYHGNLSVEENIEAAEFLLREVVPLTPSVPWLFAGKNPPERLVNAIAQIPQVKLVINPSDNEMNQLVAQAAANLLITFQPTGLKLKLLNALYSGGHCIVNSPMLIGTGLDGTCLVADTPQALAQAIHEARQTQFDQQLIRKRTKLLTRYDNRHNAELIVRMIRHGII